jgi:maleylacetate reductase
MTVTTGQLGGTRTCIELDGGLMVRFSYEGYPQDIRFGEGSIVELDAMVDQFSWRRVLFVTSGSHRRNGNAERAESMLGSRLALTFDRTLPHVQEEQVDDVTARAWSHEVDGIVGLGGGSVMGMSKAISDALHECRMGHPAREAPPFEPAAVPTIVLPTTYAGSEMTTVYGVTRPVNGGRRKQTVSGRNIVPRGVIYDPALTVDLPADITTTSAMNALAHCFEALYSIKRNPLSTAAALGGIQAIGEALPAVHVDGKDLAARTRMLDGAFLAGCALSQVAMGIHHGVCHVLGGSAGVPHGVANAIVLPHALRFNRDAAAAELAQAAVVLGLARHRDEPGAATATVIDWLDALVDEVGLPTRLREHGVDQNDLSRLAGIALDCGPARNNPRPVRDVDEMTAFLAAMW